MDIIVESVRKLEKILEHSGCSEGDVLLDVDPDMTACPYENGVSMTAAFGGKAGVFTTYDPIRARTKISFMFGASLETPKVRGAACAIINVVAGFFCLIRVLRPCNKISHAPCRKKLTDELTQKQVSCMGSIAAGTIPEIRLITDPSKADVILINGDGLTHEGTGELVLKYGKEKRILFLGPSTAGTARLNELEHWCPFGRS
jgi:hypothetical protein